MCPHIQTRAAPTAHAHHCAPRHPGTCPALPQPVSRSLPPSHAWLLLSEHWVGFGIAAFLKSVVWFQCNRLSWEWAHKQSHHSEQFENTTSMWYQTWPVLFQKVQRLYLILMCDHFWYTSPGFHPKHGSKYWESQLYFISEKKGTWLDLHTATPSPRLTINVLSDCPKLEFLTRIFLLRFFAPKISKQNKYNRIRVRISLGSAGTQKHVLRVSKEWRWGPQMIIGLEWWGAGCGAVSGRQWVQGA